MRNYLDSIDFESLGRSLDEMANELDQKVKEATQNGIPVITAQQGRSVEIKFRRKHFWFLIRKAFQVLFKGESRVTIRG